MKRHSHKDSFFILRAVKYRNTLRKIFSSEKQKFELQRCFTD